MNKKDRVSFNLSDMKKGDYISIVQYYEVLDPNVAHLNFGIGVDVQNVYNDQRTYLSKDIITRCVDSASFYKTEEKVSRTELAKILTQAKDAVFTVVFEKKNGEVREMTAHLIEHETLMGRSRVMDLEKKGIRLIDHRTLLSLVWKGVKYYV